MPHCHTLIERLRQRGYRITPQREMVIETLAHSGRHMSAEEVYEEVRRRARSTSLATVYRTLDFLVSEGLASRNDLGGGHVVYATARHGPHVHLVCRRCGRVEEAEMADWLAEMVRQAQEQYGFAAEVQHLSIPGLCADCKNV
ncbi:MAG: Fur family transcriptional regulator [Chloroflexia bacterium]